MPRCVAGNIRAAAPFPFHDNKTPDCHKRCADGVACCGVCAGAARAGDPPGANCAAKPRPCSVDELHADRGCSARRHRRAARNHDRTRAGIARRPAGEIRWRAVPSAGCRPRDARADPSGRDHAGDSAARQPRRRSLGAAKVRFFAFARADSRRMRVECQSDRAFSHRCLTGIWVTSYMPPFATAKAVWTCGEVAQLVRARES